MALVGRTHNCRPKALEESMALSKEKLAAEFINKPPSSEAGASSRKKYKGMTDDQLRLIYNERMRRYMRKYRQQKKKEAKG